MTFSRSARRQPAPDRSRLVGLPDKSGSKAISAESSVLLLLGWRRELTFASFVARIQRTGVPGLIVGMDGAKPSPADTAVESCGRIAGLIHGRNGLTRPLEVPGFCLIHLLQHIPSSCGQYTPVKRLGDLGEIACTLEQRCKGKLHLANGMSLAVEFPTA